MKVIKRTDRRIQERKKKERILKVRERRIEIKDMDAMENLLNLAKSIIYKN